LANPDLHEAFRAFCIKSPDYQIQAGSYVIMPDHVHLFVALGNNGNLSTWMKSLKNALSKTLRSAGHEAPHWQKDFFDHVLRSTESFSSKWDYVQNNPVRAGLVAKPNDWAYRGTITSLSLG
jgi:putative transposase